MKKKTLLLLLILVVSIPCWGLAATKPLENEPCAYNQKVYNIKEKLNSNNINNSDININGFEKFFRKSMTSIRDDKVELELQLTSKSDVKVNTDIPFEARGNIIIGGVKHSLNCHGSLMPVITLQNDIVYIGPLNGYLDNIDNEDNSIILSIHYMPEKNKCFIATTIGVYNGEDKVPVILDFGTEFIETREAINRRLEIYEKENPREYLYNELNDNIKPPALDSIAAEQPSLAYNANDYDVNHKDTDYCNTKWGPIVSTSVYYQNVAKIQNSNHVYAKVYGNTSNFERFMRGTYGYNVIENSGAASSVNVKIVSSSDPFAVSGTHWPKDKTKSYNMIIPAYFGSTIGFQTLNWTFTMEKTTVSMYPMTGSKMGLYNIAEWDYYREFGLDKNILNGPDYGAETKSKGYAGNAIYSYLGGVSGPTPITVGAVGKINYWCVVNTGAGYYERYYTATSIPAASTMTIIP